MSRIIAAIILALAISSAGNAIGKGHAQAACIQADGVWFSSGQCNTN